MRKAVKDKPDQLVINKQSPLFKYILAAHFVGFNSAGMRFVYCPLTFLLSWNREDYDNGYCPNCKSFITEREIR